MQGKTEWACSRLLASLAEVWLLVLSVEAWSLEFTTTKMIREQYVAGVVGQVRTAEQIRGGTGSEVARRIEQNLPQHVLWLERTFDREALLPAFWSVRDFYLKTGTPVPEEIQSILSELPPTPASSCNVPEVIPSVDAEELQNSNSEEPG